MPYLMNEVPLSPDQRHVKRYRRAPRVALVFDNDREASGSVLPSDGFASFEDAGGPLEIVFCFLFSPSPSYFHLRCPTFDSRTPRSLRKTGPSHICKTAAVKLS